jgi:putative endonuclease
MYYVYVLQSLKDKSLYIGYTSNLESRLQQHNLGKSTYTRYHRPYKLICYIAMLYESDAQRFEEYLKSGFGRKTLNKMLRDFLKENLETSPTNCV